MILNLSAIVSKVINIYFIRDFYTDDDDSTSLFDTTSKTIRTYRFKLRKLLENLIYIDLLLGLARRIISEMESFCIWLIEWNLELHFDKIADYIFFEYNLLLSISMISRI